MPLTKPESTATMRAGGHSLVLVLKALAAARETLYQQRREQAPDVDPPTAEQQDANALALLAETALHHGIGPGTPGRALPGGRPRRGRVLADPEAPGQSVLGTACAFPLRRPGAWRATPTAWSCATTPRAGCSRSAPEHAPFRRRYAGRCSIVIAAVAFRGAGRASGRATTSATGRRAGPPRCVQPGALVSPAPPGRARGGASGRAVTRRRAAVPPAGRLGAPGRPATATMCERSCGGHPGANEVHGLKLHPNTGRPGWFGERLDLGYAIDVLHPLANG
jgi:hypothetical protein